MNDQLQQALGAAIGKATTAVEAGASFLAAEIPDVIRQLLLWKAISSAIYFLLSMALIGLVVWGARFAARWAAKQSGDDGVFAVLGIIPASVVLGIAAMLFSLDWLQILVAPKFYLVEYAAQLVRK